MIHLKFKVTETKVTLTEQSEDITRGNVNQINCTFELDSAFENLIVRAVFNNEARYVANNKCTAPEFKDYKVVVGVYGYRNNGENMEKVISPEPCTLFTKDGSYNHCIIESAEPTPTELERYYELINAELKNKQDKIGIDFRINGEGNLFLSDDGKYQEIKQQEVITDYNSLEHQPIKVLNVENGTELWDVPEGLWYIDRDIVLKDNNLNDIFLHSCDIVRKNSESYAIITPGWMASGSLFSSLEDTTLLSMENLLLNTDDELNAESTHPVSNRTVTNAVNEGKTVIKYPDDYFILAKKNTEYRYLYPGANKIQIGMPTNSSSTVDFICSLVFRSPETATEFTYSNNLKFTGDDCSDGVFVPAAKKVYNIIFWYDGYSYNAVVRGVDR